MTKQWNKGDVVVLKSGGPRMTVTKVGVNADGDPVVSCIWQETKGKGYVETVRDYDPDILADGTRRVGVSSVSRG